MAIGNRDTYTYSNHLQIPSVDGVSSAINGTQVTLPVIYSRNNGIGGNLVSSRSPISNVVDKGELVKFGYRSPVSRVGAFLPPHILPYDITAAQFDPRVIGHTALWMDASDKSSVILDGSGRVSEWRDKSGNNRHHTQSTPSERPHYTEKVNGLNAVSFVSADSTSLSRANEDWINRVMNPPATIIIVGSATADAGVFYQITDASAFQNIFFWMLDSRDGNTGDSEMTWEFNTTGFHATYTSPEYVFNSNRVFSARTDGLSNRSIRDGGVQSDFTATVAMPTIAIDTSVMGAYFPNNTSHSWLNGRFLELIIFSEYIDDTTLEYVESKLSQKWNVTF